MNPTGSRAPPDRGAVLARTVVESLQHLSRGATSALVALALAGSWLATYLAGGAKVFPSHFFYVAILLAAARLGYPAVIVTAVSAGVIAGPLLPADVPEGTSQSSSDWLARGGFFLGIGLAMSMVTRGLRASLQREGALARAERYLAEQKVAVLETVAHEFRTPITIIGGAFQSLRRFDRDADRDQDLLDAGSAATRRLSDLVDGSLAAIEAGGDSPGESAQVDLIDTCREVARGLEALGGTYRVRIQARPHRPKWHGDPQVARVVLRCLIDNALKYSIKPEEVEVVIEGSGSEVEVRIRDRGVGLGDRPDLATDAFVRGRVDATRGRAGLGLGLATARAMLENGGGELELREREGGGTEVIARFAS